MPNFDENIVNERAIAKKVAQNDVKTWLDKIPAGDRDKPIIAVGNRTFTPNQVLEEVNNDTEHGKAFQKMLERLRMKVSKTEV